jgi:hypothetical protein
MIARRGNFKKGIGCLLMLAFSIGMLQAQPLEQRIVNVTDSFRSLYPIEKVYLHTDRNRYSFDETIWFKAYLTIDEKLSVLSRVLYVDLLNDRGDVIDKKMLPLVNGTTQGDFFLPPAIASGNYTLRAYTLWMLNFKAHIFQKPLYIFGNDYRLDKAPAKKNTSFSVTLFPEGGDLVDNLSAQVAFKAIAANGLPIEVSGTLLNEAGKPVSTFNSLHDGMGQFEYTPVAGKPHTVRFSTAGGSTQTLALPVAKPEGITMTVNNNSVQKTFVVLNRSEKNKARYNNLIICAQMNSVVVFMGKVNFDEDLNATAISKKNLPPGIMQITAFDLNGLPLAERLVFVYPATPIPQPTIEATANTQPFGKNRFTLHTAGFTALNASAAIIDADAEPGGLYKGIGIMSALLLNSELKGYIHQPDYYFSQQTDSVRLHLDQLLMTQGWRRFNWTALLSQQFPPVQYGVESGISIAGRLFKSGTKIPLPNGRSDLMLKTEDSLTILASASANSNGIFVIDSLNFKNEAKLYVQGINKKKENANTFLELLPAYFDTLKNTRVFPLADLDPNALPDPAGFTEAEQRWLLNKINAVSENKFKNLEEVKVVARKKYSTLIDSLNQRYASDIFQLSDQTIPMDSNVNYVDIWLFLQRYVPGIEIGRDDFGQTTVNFNRFAGLDMFSENTPTDPTTNIMFFLNEVQVSKDIIETINPSDIGIVKVWKGSSAAVFNAPRGVIGVYTKKDVLRRDFRDRGFDTFLKKGYSVTREFYAPVYTSTPPAELRDNRVTLQWIPQVKTDANGDIVLQFYNNSSSKNFKVVLQGVDANGKLLQWETMTGQ